MSATAKRETPYLSQEDHETLSRTARRVMLSRHPNPERKGCPDPGSLRQLAFRKMAKEAMEITLHLGQCSDCFREFTDLSLRCRDSRRRLWLGVGIAAAILVAAGAMYFGSKSLSRVSPQPDRIASSPASAEPFSVQPSDVPPSTTEVAKIEAPLPVVEYHMVSPTRGAGAEADEPKALTLRRQRMVLKIHLPVGSEEGIYEVRLHRASDKKEMARYERKGDKTNGYVLSIEDDFSNLPAGSYFLVVFAPGTSGEVQGYPVRVVSGQ